MMTTITWLQIFAAIFQLITSSSGACRDTNVGIRDELKVIPDDQMDASSEKGLDFSAEFGRLHGSSAWCPYSGEMISGGPYLEINLGQIYDICGVEAQGEPGASETTSFTLSYSNDGMAFTDFNSNQETCRCYSESDACHGMIPRIKIPTNDGKKVSFCRQPMNPN